MINVRVVKMRECDLLIIGAGAAGLAAGIYSARYGLKTLILEEKVTGGLTATAPFIENYPGFIKIPGIELMDKISEHAEHFGVEVEEVTRITDIKVHGDLNIIVTDEEENTYKGKACILATGTEHRKLNVPGESELFGKGVSYCSTCDGPVFKNKKVAVVGGGNNACISAIYMDDSLNAQVSLIHRRDELRAENALRKDIKNNQKITKYWNSIVQEIKGDNKVEAVVLKNTQNNELEEVKLDGVFINIGEIPRNELAKKLNIDLDEYGYIKVNRKQETNVKGVYAAGDVTGGILQTCTAVGEGCTAAVYAYLYIQGGWYSEEK